MTHRRLISILLVAAAAHYFCQSSQAERFHRGLNLDAALSTGWDADAQGSGDCDLAICKALDAYEDCEEPAGMLGGRLHPSGAFSAEYVYTGDVFTNAHGGINTQHATDYRGNFDLVLTLDLDVLNCWPGGTFLVYGHNGHGRGITEGHVGDYQVLSNIDAENFMQVSEYWWERTLLEDALVVRLGKQDVNSEFASLDVAGDFIGSSFGYHPNIPMPTFPNPSMAAVALVRMTDSTTVAAGVWDGAPTAEIGDSPARESPSTLERFSTPTNWGAANRLPESSMWGSGITATHSTTCGRAYHTKETTASTPNGSSRFIMSRATRMTGRASASSPNTPGRRTT